MPSLRPWITNTLRDVGEILDAAFSHAQAVVAILTGDNLAPLRPDFSTAGNASHETQLTPQARPNVLFEAGMDPDRTVLVQVGEVRPFSASRHIIRLDKNGKQKAATRDTPTNRWMHDRFDWHGLAYHGAIRRIIKNRPTCNHRRILRSIK
jgi:Predicted nucleotide-binding protein containing TIR-like domain